MSNYLGTFIKKKLLKKNQNLISLDEPYEVMRCLLKGRQVSGIIDAGASNGHISKRLLRSFPTADVYAFEPNPLYAEVLQRYAKEERRFHPQFVALSDCEGLADLHITESPGSTSLFTPAQRLKEIDPAGARLRNVTKAKVVTIDNWAKRSGISKIQLMKFDIQAGELKALRGAVSTLKTSTLLIYTEIWFNPAYDGGALYSEIDSFLRECGFVLYDIFKPKYNPNGLIMWANAIFAHAHRLGL